ncbi:helix-turn-helix domain-containing protein [Mycolicibacter virginiensis]|uniref:helix-turn-helix domain-containing protein n=1 Tax=Mycolicibacter virginiensis TaxID=1795032 RepID=UPI003D9C9DBC
MERTRGIPGRFFEHKIPDPERRRDVAKRVANGERIADVAARYGVSPWTVRRYAAEFADELGAAR